MYLQVRLSLSSVPCSAVLCWSNAPQFSQHLTLKCLAEFTESHFANTVYTLPNESEYNFVYN